MKNKPIGCTSFNSPKIKPIIINQDPIGKNPRSNPATYTKFSDIIRDIFAANSKFTKSHFSFNRKEGRCNRNCNSWKNWHFTHIIRQRCRKSD